MDRLVVLVDAGYLLSQAVNILSAKKSRSRADLKLVNAAGLVGMLIGKAKSALDNDKLLRVYWYDGLKGGLSADHKAIIDVDDVQLRTGTINGQGQQKGVDSKIVIDLIELASNHAISDAVVVTGDGDLAIGIELSQRRGIRVAVLGVEELGVGVMHAQSPEVTNVADRVIRIGQADLVPYLTYVPKAASPAKAPVSSAASATTSGASAPSPVVPAVMVPTPAAPATLPVATPASAAPTATPAPAAPGHVTVLAQISAAVSAFLASQTPPLLPTVVDAKGAVEKSVDRALIFYVYTALGKRALSNVEKGQVRQAFRTQLKTTP